MTTIFCVLALFASSATIGFAQGPARLPAVPDSFGSCELCYLTLENGAVNSTIGCDAPECGYCTHQSLGSCPDLKGSNSGYCIGKCSGGSSGQGSTLPPLQVPAPGSSTSAPPVPLANNTGGCLIRYQRSQSWPAGQNQAASSVNLYLQNSGNTIIAVPYTVTIVAPNITDTQGSWNWNIASKGNGQLDGTVNAGTWQNLQPSQGNSVNIGLVVVLSPSQATFSPSTIRINGQACSLLQ